MKTRLLLISLGLYLLAACSSAKQELDANKELDYCNRQVNRTLETLHGQENKIDYTMMPRNIMADETEWNLRKATKEEWCAGFWPGILWYAYESSSDENIRKEAERFTSSLEFLSHTPAFDHDLGFLVFCSYGNGYRLTQNPKYKQIILDTADTLATLFNPRVGTILSWPRNVEMLGGHNTIMDNMINLEMLFWAAKNGGNPHLADIAVAHADKTMECHFREDYTSYHVAVYDTLSGKLIRGCTHQGYADHTMWARGQAWAIYGYTMVYRETQDPKYLDFVQHVADVYLAGLPEDGVPYWDFNAPNIPDAPRDASAAAIVASALLELSTYVEGEKAAAYLSAAKEMLSSLSSDNYHSGAAKPSFLLHSTGHHPNGSEIDASIIYADYYYIEALLRLKRLKENGSVFPIPSDIYQNPVLHADYSDPDVCAVGDDFYMTASSFNCTPGLPILHSKDLVNWRLVNHALESLEPTDFYNHPQHGKGVWAPSIRYHQGEFYIYWGDPDYGIYMVKTKDPKAEWQKPVLVKAGKGMIDPCPLWDEDGKVYLAHAWAGSRAKFNSVITVCEMNAEGTQVVGAPVMVFDGNDGVNHTVEGAKFYKRNGYYYILSPAGGVKNGWQLALRSRNVYGPYEAKIVMAQGNSNINGPHQGGWIETQSGESWFLHFQDKGAYGRVVHLNPMAWVNDWPVIGMDSDADGCGEPVSSFRMPDVGKAYSTEKPIVSDEFNTRRLGQQWQWHANYQDTFGFTSDLGFMRIYGHILSQNFVNFWEVPNLLLQKFPAERFTATTKLKVSAKADGQSSGLIVMGWDYCRISVEKQGEGFELKQIICQDAEQGGQESVVETTTLPVSNKYEAGLFPNYERDIYLRVVVDEHAVCRFFYSLDGTNFTAFATPFTAREGKWIGAKVGLFSVAPYGKERGWVDVDWFRL